MSESKYKVGDKVWVYGLGDRSENPLTEVTIVHQFDYYGDMKSVVMVPTHIEDMLYVYDDDTISPAKDKPIGLWGRMRDLVWKN